MKILHLGKYYPPAPGGIESHVQTLARGQAELGHEVSVLCVNHTDQKGMDITHSRWRKTASFRQVDGKVRVDRVGRLFGISRLEVCPSLVGRLRAATTENDLVHLHTPNPLMLFAWWIAGNRETPLVITHHSDVIKQKMLQRFVAPFQSRVYEAAKVILSDSPNYIEGSLILQKFIQKVDVLPLGIDLESYFNPESLIKEQESRIRKTHGHPLWLMVGRMTYYKGYHVALEALAKVDGKLVIVGTGPLESELRKKASSLGVLDKIIWMANISEKDLTALYYAATALWFPSVARSEGFGLVQVEAMACGCPVINTRIQGSGVPWVSLDGISGLTVEVNDSEGLAKAARNLSFDLFLRNSLSEGARARAAALFDSNKMAINSIIKYLKQ